jgi:chemotaxis signal transduction protein
VRVEERITVRKLPHAALGVFGLVAFAAAVIPVFDGAFLITGNRDHRYADSAVTMVFRLGSRLFAVPVDEVLRTLSCDATSLRTWRTPPPHAAAAVTRAVINMADREYWVIDLRRAFGSMWSDPGANGASTQHEG